MKTRGKITLLVGIALTSGCGGNGDSFAKSPCSPTSSKWANLDPPSNLPVAPESQRVDRYAPTFSTPTKVTNPLHPSSKVRSALLLGEAEGKRLRVEVTLLRKTKTIPCGGESVQALESQYVAFLDGRIHEVALDWYAQDDEGAVWYLGEDVFNYENGVVADTEGTWMAGRDGPAAMIMPADPRVGDVYRPENIPALVFEEVTVKQVGGSVDGPRGEVEGAIVVDELHMDGAHEAKTFAPGYGEFATGAGNDIEAIALAVPTDRKRERRGRVPPLLEKQLDDALSRRDDLAVRHARLDLQLQYLPPAQIDRARFGLWTEQVELDAAARSAGALKGDVATLERIADRFPHRPELRLLLRLLRQEVDSGEFAAAARTAVQLRQNVASAA